MTKPERERRAKEIIAASGADTPEHLAKAEGGSLGVTFREQAAWWIENFQRRKRKPVAPGTIDTAIGQGVPEFRRHLLKHRIPIGRAGHVDDVAALCLYLASDASKYMTGAIIPIDGGWTAS